MEKNLLFSEYRDSEYMCQNLIYSLFILILTIKDYLYGNIVNRNCYIK